MDRLFLAAWPDALTSAALRELGEGDEHGVRLVPEPNWHITLRFLGDADERDVVGIVTGLTLPAVRAIVGPSVERLDDRQIVVPVTGVDRLAAVLRDATAALGRPDQHAFRGHLTIARTTPDASSALLGRPVAGDFDVNEVALVRSELRPAGANYTTVATFPTVPVNG
ncbi:MAG: 2'-5' RNA ligase family protein [Ilumatobacteraceae bacterium]